MLLGKLGFLGKFGRRLATQQTKQTTYISQEHGGKQKKRKEQGNQVYPTFGQRVIVFVRW